MTAFKQIAVMVIAYVNPHKIRGMTNMTAMTSQISEAYQCTGQIKSNAEAGALVHNAEAGTLAHYEYCVPYHEFTLESGVIAGIGTVGTVVH